MILHIKLEPAAAQGYMDEGQGHTSPSRAQRPAGGVGIPRFPALSRNDVADVKNKSEPRHIPCS